MVIIKFRLLPVLKNYKNFIMKTGMKKYIQKVSLAAAIALLFAVSPVVTPAPAQATTTCSIVSFTVNGAAATTQVNSGSTATLAWTTSGCTSVSVQGVTYTGSAAISYSVATPQITTIQSFTLTAYGSSGSPVVRTVIANPSTVVTPPPAACAINSFTINGSASTVTVPSGSTATLAWSTSNCTSITVSGVTYSGSAANSYSVQTPPITTIQSYTLTGYNSNGTTVVRTVIANPSVVVTQSCAINSFTANGTAGSITIPSNTSVTLAWSTSNCTSLTVNGVSYTGSQAANGSTHTGNLTQSTNYGLTAIGSDGSQKSSSVYITVIQAASCAINSFTANGTSGTITVPMNTNVNLSWSTSNCTSATVNGITYLGGQVTSGNAYTGNLTQTTSYTITAFGNDGTQKTSTVTICITPVVSTCSITSFTANGSASSVTIPSNSSVLLSWSTSNCVSVTVNGTTYTGNLAANGSTNTGSLTQSTSYTLTATGSDGSQKSSTVNVNITQSASCSINSFTINGAIATVQVPSGSTATLAWSTTGCTSVLLQGVTYTGSAANTGTVATPAINSIQSFTLTAYSANGVSAVRTVIANPTVSQSCVINSFTANGSTSNLTIAPNTDVILAWSTTGCTSVTVNGVTYTGNQACSGSVDIGNINQSTSYTLRATGSNGTTTTATVNINVTQQAVCRVSSFTVNGVTSTTIPYNTSVNLVWTTQNCDTVTILGVTYSGSQASAGHVYTPLLTAPENDYTVTANSNNSGGQDSKSVVVYVTGQQLACSITSFTANGSTVTTVAYNTAVSLAWTTQNCDTVTVNGVTYTGNQAIAGSVSTSPLTATVNNYTLNASSSVGGSSDSRSVVVNVSSQPNLCAVNSFTANGTANFLQIPSNTSVTLAWSTSNCTSLTVNGVSYTGSQITSGTFNTGALNGSYNYILTAQSGTQYVTQTVTVTTFGSQQNTNTCQIESFTPAQSTVNYGGTTILTWTLSSGCQNYVTVSGTNMSSNQIYSGSVTTGPINTYSSYILTATGLDGTPVTASTFVNVNNNNNNNQSCYISYFTANGTNSPQVPSGSTATITWNTIGCSTVTISGPGVYSQNISGSMQTSPIYSSSTYTITAYGLFYNSPQTQTLYVSTNQYYPVPPVYYPPTPVQPATITPVTTVATNISTTSARLNGLIPSNSSIGSVNAYFEYGTSYSLGNQTNPQPVSAYTYSNFFDTISTSPNTTYYYRADASVNGVVSQGNIVSFTTPGTQTTPVIVNRITYGTGTGSGSVSLSIMDQSSTVNPGDILSYTVTYKNISSGDLSNVILNVVLPAGVTYRGSTQGMPTTNNTIVASLGTLTKGSQGSINIQAQADTTLTAGNNLVSTATLSFVNTSGSQDSAVAYFLNNVGNPVNQNNLGGFAFGAGFFPTTLLGWIILIAIIILLILIGRRLSDNRNVQNQNQYHPPMDPHNNLPH